MTDVTCPACGAPNAADARFCARCGTGLPTPTSSGPADQPAASGAAPTGWDLAAAGMAQEPLPVTGGPVEKRDYASWGARFGAALIDGIILTLVGFVLGAIGALIWHQVDPSSLNDWADGFVADVEHGSALDYGERFGVWALLSGIAGLVWEVLWLRSRYMAKPGQRMAGFRVTAVDGSRLSTGRAVARALAKVVYSIPRINWLTLIASAIMIGVNGRRRALHDVIAGTVCIRKDSLERLAGGGAAASVSHAAPATPATVVLPPTAPWAPKPPPLP